MPRGPRLPAPGSTIHVVARCNNRQFLLQDAADFERILRLLAVMRSSYGVTVYAYTLMSNHVHLLLQSPQGIRLGRPLRWFLTETAKAYHRTHERRGHFWEHRYRAVVVEDDLYALAALRYLDRNPVRARIVDDPTTYPWSSCAAYALGQADPLITYHPTFLGLSRYPKVRCRKYREMVTTITDPALEQRDPQWTELPVVGSPEFVGRFVLKGGLKSLRPPLS